MSNTEWMAGKIRIKSSLFTWQNGDLIDYRDYFRVTLKNEALEEKSLHFDLVVRSFGAAGGPIKSLREKDGIIFVDGAPLIYAEQKGKFGAISYAETGKDISVFLKEGNFPITTETVDPEQWASGAAALFDNACSE